jgi:DNA-directed RNA polymerase subunit RPC12/RpoP
MVERVPPIETVCGRCGRRYAVGIELGRGASVELRGTNVSRCPHCGSAEIIAPGLYSAVGHTIRVVSRWSPDRRERVYRDLLDARDADDAEAATRTVIENNRELREIATIRNVRAQTMIMLAAMIISVIALFMRSDAETVVINEKTVIEHVSVVVREHPLKIPPGSGPPRHPPTSSAPRSGDGPR